MFNIDISTVLLEARKQDKWVPVRYLVKYGLFVQNIVYFEDKGMLISTKHPTVGTLVRLTTEGYICCLDLVTNRYTKEMITHE